MNDFTPGKNSRKDAILVIFVLFYFHILPGKTFIASICWIVHNKTDEFEFLLHANFLLISSMETLSQDDICHMYMYID